MTLRNTLFLLLFTGLNSFGQFVQQSTPQTSGMHITSIHWLDPYFGYITAGNRVHVTTNGGVSWTASNYSEHDTVTEVIMESSLVRDAHFIDNLVGFAAGWNILSGNDYIMKTVDGGIHWNIVHLANPEAELFQGLVNVHFTSATHGIATGKRGHIVRTIDGGNSWAADFSLTNEDLNDLHFLDTQIGFLVGNNTLFKTIDSGLTWTAVNTPGGQGFVSGFFTSLTHGTLITSLGQIYTTTDGGANWSLNLVELGVAFRVFYTDPVTGYIVGNGVLKTTNGGSRWEKVTQTITSDLFALSFVNPSTGYIGGEGGYLAKTTNAGGQTLPVALFTDDHNPCNRLINFSNYGDPADAYSWYINGQQQSTSHNFSFDFVTDDSYEVLLEASRGGEVSTFSKVYNYSTPITPATVDVSLANNDLYICANAGFNVVVNNPEVGVIYRLLDGATVLAGPATGGGSFSMSVPNGIPSSRTLSVEGMSSNGCDTIATTQPFPINVLSPGYTMDIHLPRPTVCEEEVEVVVEVRNTLPGLEYTIYLPNNTEQFIGDGGTRAFTWSPMSGTMVVTSAELSCVILQDVQTIEIDHPVAQFTLPRLDYFLDEPVPIVNQSTPGNSQWDFGPGAPPSGLTQPTPVSYSTPGRKSIHLEIESPFGCLHTKDTVIFVFNHSPVFTPTTCSNESAPQGTATKFVKDSQFDAQGNLYQTGYTWDPVGDFGHSTYFFFLEKISPLGTLLWKKEAVLDGQTAYTSGLTYFNSYGMGLEIDSNGNLYTGMSFRAEKLVLDDGTEFTPDNLNPLHDGRFQWAVMKHAPDGNLLWKTHAASQISQLAPDYHLLADIVLSNEAVFIASLHGGNFQFSSASGSILSIPGQGNGGATLTLTKVHSSGEYVNHYNFGGIVPFENPIGLDNGQAPMINSLKLASDHAGNVIVVGHASGTLNFGTTSLIISEGTRPFIARFNEAWREAYLGQFIDPTYSPSKVHRITVDGQSAYVSGGIAEEFVWDGGINSVADSYLVKWNYTGNVAWTRLSKNLSLEQLRVTPQKIVAYGSFATFGVYDAFGQQLGLRTAGSEDAVLLSILQNGDLEWMQNVGDGQQQIGTALGPVECQAISIATFGETSSIRRLSSGGCSNSPPVLSVADESITICPGGSVQLNASGATTYEWLPATGLSNASILNPIASPVVTTEYTVTGYSGDCWSVKRVKILVAPVALTFETVTEARTVEFTLSEDAVVVWDFGDGTISTDTNPVHAFLADGDYNVCVTTVNGCIPAGSCQTLTFDCDPVVDFTMNQDAGSLGVYLFHQNPAENEHIINFGDGTIVSYGTGFNFVFHTYAQAGTYTVCVTGTNACGSSNLCKDITVVDPPCPNATQAFFGIDGRDRRQVTFANLSTGNLENPVWDFGDGGSSTELNPTHTFIADGFYDVCLTIGPACGRKQYCSSVMGCDQPQMDFSFTTQDLDVTLSNLSSPGLNYTWNYGDGTGGVSPLYHYQLEGTYNVTLTALDGCPGSSFTKQVFIVCPVPTTSFTAVVQDFSVTLSSPLTNAVSWAWDFGDGQFSTALSPTHTYDQRGQKTIILSATNACGSDQSSQQIEIVCPPPDPNTFEYSVDGLSVDFTANGTGITTWHWEFGDTEQSNEQNPTHEFSSGGTYAVCLSWGNVCGTFTHCVDIVVIDPLTALADSQGLSFYPNPVDDVLQIQLGGFQATHTAVYDPLGRQIVSQTIPPSTSTVRIDFSSFTSGIYLVRCFSGEASILRKVLVQH